MISLQLQLREPPVECGYPLSAKMLRIKHADCFAILPVALDAAAAFQDFVHIRGGLLEMRQHSAARPRSGYFGVTLILNHLIGPSERRRIECCLRPIRARLRPVRTKLLRNVSRARDMGPLPSRGARSAPQPRVRRNGEIRPKTDLSPYARMALAPGRQSPRVSETPTASPSYARNIVYRNPLRAGG